LLGFLEPIAKLISLKLGVGVRHINPKRKRGSAPDDLIATETYSENETFNCRPCVAVVKADKIDPAFLIDPPSLRPHGKNIGATFGRLGIPDRKRKNPLERAGF
jgi:hypothetical protein